MLINQYDNMKRILYLLIVLLMSMTLTGCSDEGELALGYTPAGVPITLFISTKGVPSIRFNKRIVTPIGAFNLTTGIPDASIDNMAKHVTYVEIINRLDDEKHVIELFNDGESIEWDTQNSHIRVENRTYSTLVTVESDEITNFLHKKEGPGYKPDFPETPLPYFWLFKTLKARVNWEIDSVGDFFANVFFYILAAFAIFIDLLIIIIIFILRLVWWMLLLIGYVIGWVN